MIKKILFVGILVSFFSGQVTAQAVTKTTGVKTSSAPAKLTPTPTKIIPSVEPVNGVRLTLSPVFINLTTDPAVPVSSQFKIINEGTETEYLELTIQKFSVKNGSEAPIISELSKDDVFANWVKFDSDQFIIPSNGTKTVKFQISPPKDAALGYYYAFVINRIKGKSNTEVGGALLNGAPALPVILEVRSPNAKRELQIEDFRTSQVVYEYLPVEFQIKIKNTGNIHVVPVGDIFIDWGNKNEVGIVRANPSKGNVLPQSERTFTANWDDGFMVQIPKVENGIITRDKEGKPVYTTKTDFAKADKFRIGKYTAHVLLVYDNGQRDIPMEATVSFWVIPWKIIAVAIVIAALALFGLRSLILSFIKKISAVIIKK